MSLGIFIITSKTIHKNDHCHNIYNSDEKIKKLAKEFSIF